MAGFIPKDKLSKKAQKELNRQRRVTWDFSPVTRTVDSRKLYNRKKNARNRDDDGLGVFLSGFSFRRVSDESRIQAAAAASFPFHGRLAGNQFP